MVPATQVPRLVLAAALAAGAAAPLQAHHSRAAFDSSVEVTIEGVVADVVWANPHIYMMLDVTGADGRPAKQEVEVGPLSTVGPLGLTRDVLTVGDRVQVRANPNRQGPGHIVVGLDVTKGDGSIYPLHVFGRSRPPPAGQRSDSLAGKWVPLTAGFSAIIAAGPKWPLTDTARRGLTDAASQKAAQADCVPWQSPLLMALPMLRTIDIAPDTIKLSFDWMNAERVVHMNLGEHPAKLDPTLQGHSIGRWEGATLVIDTVGFTPDREGTGYGIPSGPEKQMTERLTLNADHSTLTYEYTLRDPLSVTAPVSSSMQWAYRPDLEPSGQQCNTEIASRFLTYH